jgi:Flp pilus assembly protein TadD
MASMVRGSLIGLVVLVATATHAAAAPRQPAFDETELVSGAALALSAPAVAPGIPTRDEAIALDAEMRAFVAPVAALRDARQKMLALIEGMEQRGMFSLDYAEVTRTASDTFHDRQGNCLSFTMLFVALARAAGLTASYQTVEVPPSWTYDGQVVIATHVNAAVRTGGGEQTIVDFNLRPYQGMARSRRVGDSYALALFYTNLGAEAMLKADSAAAIALLREAAAVEPDIAGLWVNLGVLYARHGRFEHAEAAYLRALEADDEEPSALANLALVYESLGEAELAAEYRERVQDYRERNPYYHYALAERAYARLQLADALASLRKAVRLKQDEHQFYVLRGQVLTALDRNKDAARSFERARRYSEEAEQRARSRVEFEAAALR